MSGKKRPHSDLIEATAAHRKRPSKAKAALRIKNTAVTTEQIGDISSVFRATNNPQATLLGLPAELRLQIYSYLCESTIVHVHHHRDDASSRFTWTPCRSPSTASPLLCANPKWSGMCEEEERCTYKIYAPQDPVGFWALAASNKSIRNESQEFFLRKTVVSIHPRDLQPWLDRLAEKDSGRLDNLRRLTLAGPNSCPNFSNATMQLVRDRIPNLEGLGIQFQDVNWSWTRPRANNDFSIDREAWRRWRTFDWLKAFDPSVTIALEAMKWYKVDPHHNPDDIEQQVAFRVIREGRAGESWNGAHSGLGWSDDDVVVEVVQPGSLASNRRYAKWRQWWLRKDMYPVWAR